MKVKEIDQSEKSRFNDFVARFSTADFMQAWEWGDVKSKSSCWRPIRLIGENDSGEIVASATMLLRRIPKVGRTIAYIPRGPVLDTADAQLVKEFIEGLRTSAASHGAILIKIDPPIPIEDEASTRNIESAGFKPLPDSTGFGGIQPKCVMLLDLVDNIDDVFANFKEKWRYNIRLAARKGVKIKSDCSRDDLKQFFDLYKITAARDGFIGRPCSYFETLWDILEPQGQIKLFLSTFEDKYLGGALAFVIGDRATYVYGASSNEHRNLMPNHLMQWEMIQWAKSLGCKWYDFRGVSPKRGASQADDHLQGLNRFKEGFNARYVEYIGEYDMVLSPIWYWLWVKFKPAFVNFLKRRARKGTSADSEV